MYLRLAIRSSSQSPWPKGRRQRQRPLLSGGTLEKAQQLRHHVLLRAGGNRRNKLANNELSDHSRPFESQARNTFLVLRCSLNGGSLVRETSLLLLLRNSTAIALRGGKHTPVPGLFSASPSPASLSVHNKLPRSLTFPSCDAHSSEARTRLHLIIKALFFHSVFMHATNEVSLELIAVKAGRLFEEFARRSARRRASSERFSHHASRARCGVRRNPRCRDIPIQSIAKFHRLTPIRSEYKKKK